MLLKIAYKKIPHIIIKEGTMFMEDNIIIEEIQFTEDLYKKNLEENDFAEDDAHGIGDDTDGNS